MTDSARQLALHFKKFARFTRRLFCGFISQTHKVDNCTGIENYPKRQKSERIIDVIFIFCKRLKFNDL
jgi:hypothetical protein